MKTTLNTVIQFNPSERLKKGETCRKVAMEHVHVFSRCITEWENVTYNGGTKFRNGDTLLARITPCLENGKTAMVSFLNDGEVACGSTEFIVLRAIKGKTDPFFVYYLAISKLFRDLAIKSMVGSTGRQRVQQNVIENAIMEVPTLTEQKKIVAVLSTLDSKIELNTQINQNLETWAA
ncbi:MAG: restriction endonuclease subunit S [Victivallales bacterium]|nr:restriction endonuclease subunit S [Victivallales bacterium]